MDSERRNGFKRNSARQESHSRPVERRPSKKSSSKDRHGIVYPDNFQDSTIRTVTPDPPQDQASNSLASDTEYLPPSTAVSPRTTIRSKPSEARREFTPFYSTGEEDETPAEQRSRRLRSKTTTLEDQRSEVSPNFLSRTRTRLGSLNTTSPSSTKSPEDSVGSIGYPSIIQSPTQRQQKLIKPPPGGQALMSSASRIDVALGSPFLNTDSSKILQLMKTTCGRMHGILYFRTSVTASWTSGYCAINVATGSLIYQAKGEPALAKTLIPDLRGCHVRTLYDTETQSSYLSVSTHSSTLGIQLRPHVNETFDSWLAALLCWQPIRPKGVRDKMTKPQTVTIGERRFIDRRRNSESTVQKDAAIIKVGKMLLWDKPSAAGVHLPTSAARVSTFKQQRALSPSWRRVSCSLQENGHVKIFPESDITPIHFIQLSQLSRCAIQQLDPSVLEDEFCIAIYPQYTAHSGAEVTTRPIYLSFETRVLFEVWFVLFRAFTIPELYGPEQFPSNEDPRSQTSTPHPTFLNDMFRIERLLSVRVIEAKMTAPLKDDSDTPKNKKIMKTQATIGKTQKQNPAAGEYYAEVLLDGEIRAKTAIKATTSTPFWREDFSFHDLPPVLSSASVIVKSLTPTQKEWTLVTHGPYSLNQGEVNPMTVGDVEVASHDATYGKIDLRLDELDAAGVEKWWPILDENEQQAGEMLMKVQLEETVVLVSQDYAAMSELLHSFPNGLTIQLAQVIPAELRPLSETLLDIFQVSGQAGEWIMALVEDEIDGIHKESSASRLRYTSRIHSNDSYESGQEREVLVRDLGRSATVEANLLFRGNSLLTKALDLHMRRLGQEYLEETIGSKLRDIDESDPDCEIDPNRVQRPEDLERNWRNLIILTSSVWTSIAASSARCPAELRHIFRHIRACAEDRYGDFLRSVTYSSVSGFLFLRFFCPAILNPKLFGLLKEHPRPRAQRTLTLVAKALQGLANLTTFGNKEPWMEPMNKFLISHRVEFKEFVDSICSIPAERPTQIVNPSYATPIQILGRLPPTSREGFPSLPFLIDHARSFALLVRLWLDLVPTNFSELPDVDANLIKFHELCVALHQRTKDCLNRAEQAERPSGNLELRWEELVEQMEKSSTFYEESSSKANTPSMETIVGSAGSTFAGSNRNSMGYFPRPSFPHRSTDVSAGDEADDDTPSSSASATWEHGRLPFSSSLQKYEPRESADSSKNSSTYSLEYTDTAKGRQASVSRDAASKYRLFETFSRRNKGKDKEPVCVGPGTRSKETGGDVGPRNEF
ncbi:GTPase activating protein [Histoplasma capsulatum G186AR]|uniref:GTPase activating protein n=2 Tax=Ajellomyces capsulatus TaxID=5037 RepID=C0NH25_AJECG|nr:GTPase activating protein [Histoplasma capsulatum G186AR]EEH09110.1 GTPase activating protein [Histoplasma capsulatum G186AR]KAG5303570.1 GTPase activating protein [Histoplasma capsulatum]QSS69167.1 GTPase activating protein [Histoplasma capsulatum G186AR]